MAVNYQINRLVWEIDDSDGKIRIENIDKSPIIIVFHTIYANTYVLPATFKSSLTEKEYTKLETLFKTFN